MHRGPAGGYFRRGAAELDLLRPAPPRSSQGKAPLQRAVTQSSHSAIASPGLNVEELRLSSTHSPSSSAESAMAAGRSLKGGAVPVCASCPSKVSSRFRYLP